MYSRTKNVYVKVSSHHKQALLISMEELRITENTIFRLPHCISTDFMFYDTNKQAMCSYNVTTQRVRVTILAVEKQLSITYSECVSVALFVQHAMCMRRTMLSSVACLAVPYLFLRYLINDTIIGGGGSNRI